ncbi:MAG: hypothetical protein U0167_00250 [bacterium]
MSRGGAAWEVILASASAVAVALMVPVLSGEIRRLGAVTIPIACLAAAAFKHAMVRQDAGHTTPLQIQLALYASFFLVRAKTVRARVVISCYQAVAMIIWGGIAAASFPGLASRVLSAVSLRTASSNVRWLLSAKGGQGAPAFPSALELEPALRARMGVSPTADAVPWGVSRILANGLAWCPRPVLQDYAAYTPSLDAWQAAHFEGDDGAEWILFSFRYVDGHHPFLETPAMWRALLDRYSVVDRSGDVLLLGRHDGHRLADEQPIRRSVLGWGEWLDLPTGPGLVVLRANVLQSWRGRLLGLLLRDLPVWLECIRADGASASWRTVPANLPDGAIVSILPSNLSEMQVALQRPGMPRSPARVRSIRFRTSSAARYRPKIDVDLSLVPTTPGFAAKHPG